MIKWFQMLIEVSFPLIDPEFSSFIDILLENLIPQIGAWIWKTPSAHYFSGVGISFKPCLLFKKIFSSDLFFDVLIIGLI